jgi:hypothetical protein
VPISLKSTLSRDNKINFLLKKKKERKKGISIFVHHIENLEQQYQVPCELSKYWPRTAKDYGFGFSLCFL